MIEDNLILNDIIKWWEKRRIIFNISVGFVGAFAMLMFSNYFNFEELTYLLVYGIIANIFYSLGILCELLDLYYLNGFLKLKRFRTLLLIFGILFSCLITFVSAGLHYMTEF